MNSVIPKTMVTYLLASLTASASLNADTFGSSGNEFTIEFVTVGDPGNPNDSGTTGSYHGVYGGVDDIFRMGQYEVSRNMITKANAEAGLGLTLADMSSYGGNIGTHPASGISWNEAARFVNFLNEQAGFSHAYKFALQPGAGGYSANADLELWSAGDAGFDPANPYRNSNAYYFLPSEDEWYKAAYYSGSGTTYFDYATQRDDPNWPTPVASGTATNTAVYDNASAGPADIDDAGWFSHYRTMAQNGNVWEWVESASDGINDSASEIRRFRGGAWDNSELALESSFWGSNGPSSSFNYVGFRVASVPEPSTVALVLMGIGGLMLKRSRQSSC